VSAQTRGLACGAGERPTIAAVSLNGRPGL
jgi:hypothetical protein